jgi:hypothetical protein
MFGDAVFRTPPNLRQEPKEAPNGELLLGIVAVAVLTISLPILFHV